MFLGAARTRELLAIIDRAGSISIADFARAAFPADNAIWRSPPPKRRRWDWKPGGRARSSAGALLGELRQRHLVWSRGNDIFSLTDAGRELLHRATGADPAPLPQVAPPPIDDQRWYRSGNDDWRLDDAITGNRWRREKDGRLHLQRAGMTWEAVTWARAEPPVALKPVQWTDGSGRLWFRGVANDTWTWEPTLGTWVRVA